MKSEQFNPLSLNRKANILSFMLKHLSLRKISQFYHAGFGFCDSIRQYSLIPFYEVCMPISSPVINNLIYIPNIPYSYRITICSIISESNIIFCCQNGFAIHLLSLPISLFQLPFQKHQPCPNLSSIKSIYLFQYHKQRLCSILP